MSDSTYTNSDKGARVVFETIARTRMRDLPPGTNHIDVYKACVQKLQATAEKRVYQFAFCTIDMQIECVIAAGVTTARALSTAVQNLADRNIIILSLESILELKN